MNFFIDYNLPPNWAAVIAAASKGAFSSDQVGEVRYIRDRFAADTPDAEWLRTLGEERDWTVISGDAFRKKKGAERKVIREHGLSVFVLQPSWSSRRYWEKTAQFILWWPRIVAQANAIEGTALEVPWRTTTRFRQI